mgnify:CR=1 FL=1
MEVTAKEVGYYGGELKEIGATFTIEKEEHLGKWMVKGKGLPDEQSETFTGYVAARSAAGKFVVKDAAGQVAGKFIGTKDEAEVEAQRLNDGGEIA